MCHMGRMCHVLVIAPDPIHPIPLHVVVKVTTSTAASIDTTTTGTTTTAKATTSALICPSTKYVDTDNECKTCPSGFTCDGKTATCASTKYVDNNECKACPTGFTCDGNTTKACPEPKYVTNNECKACPSGSVVDGTGQYCEKPARRYRAPDEPVAVGLVQLDLNVGGVLLAKRMNIKCRPP